MGHYELIDTGRITEALSDISKAIRESSEAQSPKSRLELTIIEAPGGRYDTLSCILPYGRWRIVAEKID